eukprot:gb/GFBE01041094.1/.p1 GENE.gb/GFBE01041094.1/~~gb/GFBE01041094.1/.p1  ORF type:complete len:254 (+),score=60.72 gb/GFBE01041094.1/:1-762(+)
MDSHVVCPVSVAVWESLLKDDESKDIELIGGDSSVRCHEVVMAAASDVFKQMLGSQMKEAQEKRVQLKCYTGRQLKFIVRLLYTGQVDPADWAPEEELSPTTPCEHVLAGTLTGAEATEDSARVPRAPKLAGWRSRRLPTSSSEDEDTRDVEPPLSFLLATCSFSKQYQIRGGLCAQMVSKIKKRVKQNIHCYEEVFCFAIAEDIGPLRLFCINFAKESAAVRRRFEKGDLQPQVAFELHAIWEAPAKKRKFF